MANPDPSATQDSPVAPAPPPASGDAPATAIQQGPPAPAADTAVTGQAPAAEPADTPPDTGPSPETLAARARILDRVLIGLVLGLAFLLGSFAIHNGDFWMYLATGRAIAQGEHTFGVDPFASTTQGVTWVNHAWLFDWLLYGAYTLLGGTGIVVLKALLVVVLAAVLLAIRRPGQSLWLPALCTALALLPMSIRLLVYPALVSMLFLALTLYLLHRGAGRNAEFTLFGRSLSPLWLLPPLFALWVNLDGWFLLGPLTVALFLGGAALQRLTGGAAPAPGEAPTVPDGAPVAPRPSARPLRTLSLVALVGLTACLLNPYFHRAFLLPVELAYPLADVLPPDAVPAGVTVQRVTKYAPQLYRTFSPFGRPYWSLPGLGLNVAGMAYYPLLLLGAVSFALRALPRRDAGPADAAGATDRFPVALFLVWLAFAAFSALDLRFLGFFAVVAGPAASLNLQGLAARSVGGRERNWSIGGRLLTAAGCVVLLLLAWPGWLHGHPNDPRRSHRVAWRIDDKPLLEKAGRRLDELLQTGKLANGFNLMPETGYTLAWFGGPRVKSFFDNRFALFAEVAQDYGKARLALSEEALSFLNRRPTPAAARQSRELRRIFRHYKINYVVLTGLQYDDRARALAIRFLAEPGQWPPLYLDGPNVVFGWRDPDRAGNPFAGLSLDFDRLAFGSVPPDRRAPANGTETPESGPDPWTAYVQGTPAPSPAALESQLYRVGYVQRSTRWQEPTFAVLWGSAWHGPAATTAVVPAMLSGAIPMQLWSGPVALHSLKLPSAPPSRLAVLGGELVVRTNDAGPPSLPLLAVRGARRATAESPADGEAYFALANAYQALWRIQEAHWQDRAAPAIRPVSSLGSFLGLLRLPSLRHVQYVTALNHALRFNPDDPDVHLALKNLYREMNYPDAALAHLEKARAYYESITPSPEQEAQFETKRQRLDAELQDLGDEVKRRREEYDVHSANDRTLVAKVMTALLQPTTLRTSPQTKRERGLVLLALKLLKDADLTRLDLKEQTAVVQLQMRLMLMLGMAKELREAFDTELRQQLKPLLGPDYDEFEAVYAVAVGNYAQAEKYLAAVVGNARLAEHLAVSRDWENRLEAEMKARLVSLVAAAPLWSLSPSPLTRFTLSLGGAVSRTLVSLPGKVIQAEEQLRQVAEVNTLRGLLALEQGDTDRATELFRESLRIARSRIDFPTRPLAVRYLALLERQRPKGTK